MKTKSLKIYIFYCSTGLDTSELFRRFSRSDTDMFKIISLPCSGKVDVLYLLKAFETGADGVVLITCPAGECRYLEGNLRAVKRARAVDALLDEIGMQKGRMTVIQMQENGMDDIVDTLKSFIDRIGSLVSSDKAQAEEEISVKITDDIS